MHTQDHVDKIDLSRDCAFVCTEALSTYTSVSSVHQASGVARGSGVGVSPAVGQLI